MKQENLEMLISLMKIKQLAVSEMKKDHTKGNDAIDGLSQTMIDNQNLEIKIFKRIIKSEKKDNETR